MRIGVDVDLCVVDTGSLWVEWLENLCRYSIDEEAVYDYDLTKYFREDLEQLGVDGFGFWRQSDLYDNLSPIEGSVKTLQKMSELNHEILFISAIKGFHVKSKYYFLDKYFPFKDAYISTKEKGYVNVDVMIDDRLENLYQFDDNVVKILFWTRYRQNVELRDDILVAYDWNDVDRYLQEL